MRVLVNTVRNARKSLEAYFIPAAVSYSIESEEVRAALEEATHARRVRIRYITEITNENLSVCRALVSMGIELRHMAGINGSFGLNESECIAAIFPEGILGPPHIIYSNVSQFVEHHGSIFNMFWGVAIPASVRIGQLEKEEENVHAAIKRAMKKDL